MRRTLGFTLLEALIALSLLALVGAVTLPALARRVDAAYRDADLARIAASARSLAMRCASLGAGCEINPTRPLSPSLADDHLTLLLPPGWQLGGDSGLLRIGRGGVCGDTRWRLIPSDGSGSWWLFFDAPACTVRLLRV